MKTEKYYRKKAGFIFLFDIILYLIGALIFHLAVYEPLQAAVNNGQEITSVLDVALGAVIACVVIEIVIMFLSLAWWITFVKLWKYYGPRFWRCTWVILGVLSFIYYVTGIVLLVAFNINILYL